MPNGPTANVLYNSISWFRWNPLQDPDAGAIGTASTYDQVIADGIPCGIHLTSSTETYDAADRPTTVNTWKVSMRSDVGLQLKDKGQFSMDGISHSIFVEGYVNRSGRSVAYEAICTERLSAVSGNSLPSLLVLQDRGLLLLETGDGLELE